MTEHDRLPVGPAGEPGSRLPVRHESMMLSATLFEDEQSKDPDEIDLLAYWRMLVKRRWLIISIAAVAAVLALLWTISSVPMYRATAVVQIETPSQQVITEGEVAMPSYGWDPDFVNTQIGLLNSRALAERVADDLNVDQATIDSLQPASWWRRAMALVNPAAAKPGAESGSESGEQLTAEQRRGAAVGAVAGGLSVSQRPNTRLVDVSHTSTNPQFAARVANAYVDGFIASEQERRFGTTSYASTYLEEQLAVAKDRLESSERALVEFAQKEGLVNLGDGQSLVGRNLSDLNSQLATAQAERIRTQARWSQAQASGTLPSDVLSASLVPTLRGQLADLRRRYQEQLQVFKPEYPQMQQLQGQIDELQRQINTELGNARASLRSEYNAAAAQEGMLKGQLASLRTQTLDTDNRSIQYNILQRETDTNRQLYDSLLQRFKQVGAASQVRPNNISVVDRAQAPGGPFSPNMFRNLLLGLMLGLLVGVALALLLEFLDDTLKSPEDIEQRLKMPVLGIIPKLGPKQTVAVAASDQRSAFSEAYRSVRTALQFSTDQGVPRILLVTSAGPGEGKSTSALALARNFAQLGKRVLLIEGDLRNPSLHKSTGQRAEAGFSNLLAGNGTLAETIISGGKGEPDLLLSGPLPPNPAELLAGSHIREVLDAARAHYDQIIIDGPPIMGIADSPLLAHVVDGTLMAVGAGHTKTRDAQVAIKRLMRARAHLLGVLLTKYDAKAAGHGYQYEGYYAYGGPPRLGQR